MRQKQKPHIKFCILVSKCSIFSRKVIYMPMVPSNKKYLTLFLGLQTCKLSQKLSINNNDCDITCCTFVSPECCETLYPRNIWKVCKLQNLQIIWWANHLNSWFGRHIFNMSMLKICRNLPETVSRHNIDPAFNIPGK